MRIFILFGQLLTVFSLSKGTVREFIEIFVYEIFLSSKEKAPKIMSFLTRKKSTSTSRLESGVKIGQIM